MVERPDGNGRVSSDDLLTFALRFGRGARVPLAVYRFVNLFRATFLPDEALDIFLPPFSPRLELRIDRSCASLARIGSSMSSEDDEEEDEEDDSPSDDEFDFLALDVAIGPSPSLLLELLLSSSSAIIRLLLVGSDFVPSPLDFSFSFLCFLSVSTSLALDGAL